MCHMRVSTGHNRGTIYQQLTSTHRTAGFSPLHSVRMSAHRLTRTFLTGFTLLCSFRADILVVLSWYQVQPHSLICNRCVLCFYAPIDGTCIKQSACAVCLCICDGLHARCLVTCHRFGHAFMTLLLLQFCLSVCLFVCTPKQFEISKYGLHIPVVGRFSTSHELNSRIP